MWPVRLNGLCIACEALPWAPVGLTFVLSGFTLVVTSSLCLAFYRIIDLFYIVLIYLFTDFSRVNI